MLKLGQEEGKTRNPSPEAAAPTSKCWGGKGGSFEAGSEPGRGLYVGACLEYSETGFERKAGLSFLG